MTLREEDRRDKAVLITDQEEALPVFCQATLSPLPDAAAPHRARGRDRRGCREPGQSEQLHDSGATLIQLAPKAQDFHLKCPFRPTLDLQPIRP